MIIWERWCTFSFTSLMFSLWFILNMYCMMTCLRLDTQCISSFCKYLNAIMPDSLWFLNILHVLIQSLRVSVMENYRSARTAAVFYTNAASKHNPIILWTHELAVMMLISVCLGAGGDIAGRSHCDGLHKYIVWTSWWWSESRSLCEWRELTRE